MKMERRIEKVLRKKQSGTLVVRIKPQVEDEEIFDEQNDDFGNVIRPTGDYASSLRRSQMRFRQSPDEKDKARRLAIAVSVL